MEEGDQDESGQAGDCRGSWQLQQDRQRCDVHEDEGLMHRSRRPIEPEAVFGQIKYDNHFKRFSYRGKRLINAEFATIVVAHNIRKMISKGYCVCSEVAVG